MRVSIKILCVSLLLLCGCGPNESILKSGANNDNTAPAPQASHAAYDSVESEIENMRTADFNFILVLRRKDGGKMQADDKAFVRTNMSGANRRSLVDSEKAIVIGSNARVPHDLLTKLGDRFDVQDFSKPEAEIPASPSPVNANMMH
jgi:hypothetical protein